MKKKARVKFIHTAVQRAKAKEVDINCDGYYPVCPNCGSWEVERNRGELWSFCPECGQRVKQPEISKEGERDMTREKALENAKPILFNTDMVRAILDGRKTVTRRIVKPQPDEKHKYILGTVKTETPSCGNVGKIIFGIDKEGNAGDWHYARPPYRPGEILYVRETWCQIGDIPQWDKYYRADGNYIITPDEYVYKADNLDICDGILPEIKWHPSIHMPKEAARIFLKVKSVRVERLQEIDDEGAKAEGANCGIGVAEKMREDAIARFKRIWDPTIKKADLDTCGWKANPWVWVIEFEKLEVGE